MENPALRYYGRHVSKLYASLIILHRGRNRTYPNPLGFGAPDAPNWMINSQFG
ncbi:hypothetical protein SAMD00023353_1002590 [Rosellinia necatrix]|uniref:Uncharacterized protein n=1 Tax=Rosellinia necatrix TaxID=77044 RepID=A0A1S8A6I4_ROSNE|nr:hypothetical protein SAMD00023353_1002590 [Rosellinia necatrix]